MGEANILAYRIVYFEQDESAFHGPETYPRTAMACLSTHDLPPLAGWWRGDDIRLRAENGLISEEAAGQQREHRVWERRELAKAMAAKAAAASRGHRGAAAGSSGGPPPSAAGGVTTSCDRSCNRAVGGPQNVRR